MITIATKQAMQLLAQALFVTCVRGHASGKARDLSSRVYFVASGLGFGQEECYRHLWYNVAYTYLFSLLITQNTLE